MDNLTEDYEMLIPDFRSEYCDNCHKPAEEYATLHKRMSRGGVSIIIHQTFCLDCLPEVIQYRHMIRNVSEMTKEIVHQHNREVYDRVYDNVNFRKS